MSRQRTARRSLLAGLTATVAALGLIVATTIGPSAAQTTPGVVYDAIGPTLPPNVSPSQNFEAEEVDEFGDLVTLAAGPRELKKVSVALSSQACLTGSGTADCDTPAGTPPFEHELTMTLYEVAGTPETPAAGDVIAEVIDKPFTIPYRPSASEECEGEATPGMWYDDASDTCFTGVTVVVDFEFPAGTTLPNTLIWGISYNTETSGLEPEGVDGPYDFLNVGASTVNPTIGTDVNEDMAFIAWPATEDAFDSDLGWTGERPMARIEVVVPATATTSTTAAPGTPTTTASTGSTAARTGGAPLSPTG